MYGHESFIAIFFRFANCAVVIGLGIYVFRKYALPTIFVSMAEQREAHEHLEHQQADLEAAHALVAQELQDDLHLCTELKAHIDEWKKRSDEKHILFEKEREKRISELHTKIAEREKIREYELIQAVIAEKVVIELRESLSHYFDQKERSALYIEAVINDMESALL